MSAVRVGIDIGGTGMKAATVDLKTGALVSPRIRVNTPSPSNPVRVSKALRELVAELSTTSGAVGVGFPAVVEDGLIRTANNISPEWLGVNARNLFEGVTNRRIHLLNDADAAAVAEARLGAAKGVRGKVVVITFGTGIGSGLLVDGVLVPNLELGQMELDGARPAEARFSAKAKKNDDIPWLVWGRRANLFLTTVALLFNPDLILVSGGAAKTWAKWSTELDTDLPVRLAHFLNNAGIVGAAIAASE